LFFSGNAVKKMEESEGLLFKAFEKHKKQDWTGNWEVQVMAVVQANGVYETTFSFCADNNQSRGRHFYTPRRRGESMIPFIHRR
jgi:hypothetical protein